MWLKAELDYISADPKYPVAQSADPATVPSTFVEQKGTSQTAHQAAKLQKINKKVTPQIAKILPKKTHNHKNRGLWGVLEALWGGPPIPLAKTGRPHWEKKADPTKKKQKNKCRKSMELADPLDPGDPPDPPEMQVIQGWPYPGFYTRRGPG